MKKDCMVFASIACIHVFVDLFFFNGMSCICSRLLALHLPLFRYFVEMCSLVFHLPWETLSKEQTCGAGPGNTAQDDFHAKRRGGERLFTLSQTLTITRTRVKRQDGKNTDTHSVRKQESLKGAVHERTALWDLMNHKCTYTYSQLTINITGICKSIHIHSVLYSEE